MHALVDIIPSLLHLSLLFFFGGLVAFLQPVHRLLISLMSTVLAVFLILYLTFTILPVIRISSPYQTPISPLLWRVLTFSCTLFKCFMLKADGLIPNMVDALVHESYHSDKEKRDLLSVAWTLGSLVDDLELLPFIEAIPDVIYGPRGLRIDNFHLLRRTLETSDSQQQIICRIQSMMENMQSPRFGAEYRKRCRIACPKALWSISYMLHHDIKWRPLDDIGESRRDCHWFSSSVIDCLESSKTRGLKTFDFDRFYALPALFLVSSIVTPHKNMLAAFLVHSLDLFPYEFYATCEALHRAMGSPDHQGDNLLELISERVPSDPAVQSRDHIFTASLLLCTSRNVRDALRYLAQRNSRQAIRFIWHGCNRRELADCVPRFCRALIQFEDNKDNSQTLYFQAIWAICDCLDRHDDRRDVFFGQKYLLSSEKN